MVIRACVLAAVASGTTVFVSAQTLFPVGKPVQLQTSGVAQPPAPGRQAPAPPDPAGPVRRLSADDAVKLALEHNLGIKIARFEPEISDLTIRQARSGWTPALTTDLQTTGSTQPSNSFLSGASGNSITNDQFASSFGVRQNLPWGANYSASWDGARSTTNNVFTNFSPQLRSTMAFNYTQSLLRGRAIDDIRQQVQVGYKNREISDVDVLETVASTMRTVRRAYWDLAYANAFLAVQQQSLDLAQESLRNTRSRVEIGTTPPIDIVEAEAEVATRQEAVIVAQAQIATAEDTLRALVFDPSAPDFWTTHIETTELPPFQPSTVNVDGAVRNALDRRTDLQRSKRNLEVTDINIKYLRNQTLPQVDAQLGYGLQGLGGTQFERGAGFPGPIIGQTQRGFGSVLGDLFANTFPNWSAQLNVSYPLGTSAQEANLARTRVQQSRAMTQLQNQQLQVSTQVRLAARQVQTNQQRVETTRASRQLAERRLEAEQRKFQAGTSTSFLVFQAQRDLSQARNNELRAILDYNQSVVDFETVQEVPLNGGGGAVSAGGTTQPTN
jgi:outer membrane protein TolC